MAQQFVLAFGGTGARCVEALTYLLAARAVTGSTHVLIVDPDEANGNVDFARRQLQRYWRLHRSVGSPKDNEVIPFFSTAVNKSETDTAAEGMKRAGGERSFYWQYPNQNQTFHVLVNRSSLMDDDRGFFDLLYDEDDFDLSFEQGYVGRAHVGSFDLFRTLRQAVRQAAQESENAEEVEQTADGLRLFFRRLRAAAQGEGARVIVFGSIFGGTGASGIPAVPPLLNEFFEGRPGLRQKVKVSCVQMTPYFSFGEGAAGDPDSTLHPLATQTALYHYGTGGSGYHRIYVVGAPKRTQTSEENSRGGPNQRNRAHYAELAAALAARHYFDDEVADGDSLEVFACGSGTVRWDNLPDGGDDVRSGVKGDLIAFTAAALLHAGFLYDDVEKGRHRGARWMHDLVGKERRRTLDPHRLADLRDFSLRYLAWLREVEEDEEVALFAISRKELRVEDLAAIADDPDQNRKRNAYHALVAAMCRGEAFTAEDGTGWYVASLTRAADELRRRHYRL